ncbi:Uncharacterised protein [Mycobacteroides abscessus subsp. abscessus]|uniref:hypothetical protein n=1 Tax=Mycobacteroides abscessus TaxID=36809 RepID=UPI0009266921|nr:hypothetical protein [Mycobacteroides abscessus]SHU73199.1 Uncharacterised protein [Mycobacteroides abscessus subsp. abscessus]
MTASTRRQATAPTHPICAALSENLQARTNWEQPAQLYWLDSDTDGHVSLQPFLPPEFFSIDGTRPPDLLAAFAEFWCLPKTSMQRVVPSGFTGLAFFAEAWTVHAEHMDGQQLQQLDADAQAHRIEARGDRIEARVMWGLDREGVQYWVMQPRGYEVNALRLDDQIPLVGAGTVIDSLTAILGAITAREAD